MNEIITGLAEKLGVKEQPPRPRYEAIRWNEIAVGDGVEFSEREYGYHRVMAHRMGMRLKRTFVTAKRDGKFYIVRMK